MKDVTEHAGGVFMQVPSSLGHTVVFAPDGDVDALFLLKERQKKLSSAHKRKLEVWFEITNV